MANVEIDETELAGLRRYAQLADKVAKHPDARKLMQQAALLAAPEEVGPEPRIRQEVTEGLDAIRAELKADRDARDKRDTEQAEAARITRLNSQWAETRGQARAAGYTDEGLTQLEEWMEKRGVADHTIAMPAFERENPPPDPVMTGGQRWNFFDQPKDDISLKPLFEGNEDAFLGPAINSALKDVRGR